MPSLPHPDAPALPGWQDLSDDAQLALSRAALAHAAGTIADQAETLAGEMEEGALHDHGGPEALRLFAALLKALHTDAPASPLTRVAGHA